MLSVYQGCPHPIVAYWKMPLFAMSDGLHKGANVVLEPAAIHAGELAERCFIMDPALRRHQLAFQHDFGVSRHHNVNGLALNELSGLAVKAA